MITIKDYVKGLFSDVPDSIEKENIKQEIILNLEEKVQDLMDEGKDQEDAINKSIVDFGDIDEIKKDLMQVSGVKPMEKKKTNYTNNLWFSIWGQQPGRTSHRFPICDQHTLRQHDHGRQQDHFRRELCRWPHQGLSRRQNPTQSENLLRALCP